MTGDSQIPTGYGINIEFTGDCCSSASSIILITVPGGSNEEYHRSDAGPRPQDGEPSPARFAPNLAIFMLIRPALRLSFAIWPTYGTGPDEQLNAQAEVGYVLVIVLDVATWSEQWTSNKFDKHEHL